MITERQYQRMMKTYNQTGVVDTAAMKSEMHRHTATKYLKKGMGPQPEAKRGRRRPDPIKDLWIEAERILAVAPEVECKALFEHLLGKASPETQVMARKAMRTFQRRAAGWRRRNGPSKEVYFAQIRKPGEAIQLDWTHAKELGVTINDDPYEHLLCHVVLPYSNVQWAVPCQSESMLSLKHGLQDALWMLGRVPKMLQTDQSSTATHVLKRDAAERGFNKEYLELCEHLGLKPTTINASCPNENGDIESANGHLKRRLATHLALRGSKEFGSIAEYAAFVVQVCRSANLLRVDRFAEELAVMKPLPECRFPDVIEETVRVSGFSTVRIRHKPYSVPSRLIGAMVVAQISEGEVVITHMGDEVARYPRTGTPKGGIDYRHIVHWLRQKPGAFSGYVHREELFPRTVFRQTYDALVAHDKTDADKQYIELLWLASTRGENVVADALGAELRAGRVPCSQTLPMPKDSGPEGPPELRALTPDLSAYDKLIGEEECA